MSEHHTTLIQRRQLLAGLVATAGSAAVAGCTPRAEPGDPVWAGFDERITERTLAEAEKLMGLQFTEAERRLMLGGQAVEAEDGYFTQRVARNRQRRGIEKPNGLAPALVFDPRLPGVEYAAQPDSVTLFHEPLADRPAMAEDVVFASLKQLAHWMDKGQLTSTELTSLYLDRIARYDGQLQSFITVTSELALQQAAEADRERQAGQVRGPHRARWPGALYGSAAKPATRGTPLKALRVRRPDRGPPPRPGFAHSRSAPKPGVPSLHRPSAVASPG
jgi:hypothetical protein